MLIKQWASKNLATPKKTCIWLCLRVPRWRKRNTPRGDVILSSQENSAVTQSNNTAIWLNQRSRFTLFLFFPLKTQHRIVRRKNSAVQNLILKLPSFSSPTWVSQSFQLNSLNMIARQRQYDPPPLATVQR